MRERPEAHRRALRLPALCGPPTREEAKQGLEVSVAAQHELPGRCTSLTPQRRAVLPSPDALERVGKARAPPPVELIPGAKNWANYQNIVNLSISYKESCGPGLLRQDGRRHPESAIASGRRERALAS